MERRDQVARGEAPAYFGKPMLSVVPAASARPRHVPIHRSLCLAAVALVVFVVAGSNAVASFDADYVIGLVQGGDAGALPQHPLYLSLVVGLHRLLVPFGIGAYQAALLASAMAAAFGLFCLHRAAAWLLPADRAPWLLPVAVAVTPACFWYATTIELHAVAFAGSSLAWWCLARWCAVPRLRNAVLLGAACGIAASLHGFGHLLLPWFAVAMLLLRDVVWRERGLAMALVVLVHGTVFAAVASASGAGSLRSVGSAADFLMVWASTAEAGAVAGVLWREVVWSFLPWSVLVLLAWRCQRARPAAVMFLSGVAVFAPAVVLLLARSGDHFFEHGGYLLPIAVPAVLVAASALPRSLFVGALLLSAGLAVTSVAGRVAMSHDPQFVAAVETLRREHRLALVVDAEELAAVRTSIDGVFCAEVDRTIESYYGLARSNQVALALPEWFDAVLARCFAEGAEVFVTAAAQSRFLASTEPAVRALWTTHFPAHYAIEPVERPGLRGVWVRRR